MATNDGLKPCPFCGKRVKFEYHTGDYGYTPDTVSISCCFARISAPTEKWESWKGHFSVKNEARQQIADKWNARDSD
jgi:hypothetical protein